MGWADTGKLVDPREGIGVRDSGTLGHFQAVSPAWWVMLIQP